MAELTRSDVEQIVKDSISEVIKKELESYHLLHPHNCPIPEAARPEIGHLLGVIVDFGDGEMRKGVEVFRSHSAFIKKLLGWNKKISDTIAKIIIIGMITAIMTLIGLSIKQTLIDWITK